MPEIHRAARAPVHGRLLDQGDRKAPRRSARRSGPLLRPEPLQADWAYAGENKRSRGKTMGETTAAIPALMRSGSLGLPRPRDGAEGSGEGRASPPFCRRCCGEPSSKEIGVLASGCPTRLRVNGWAVREAVHGEGPDAWDEIKDAVRDAYSWPRAVPEVVASMLYSEDSSWSCPRARDWAPGSEPRPIRVSQTGEVARRRVRWRSMRSSPRGRTYREGDGLDHWRH
jgi:hypothetical protein